MKLRKYTRFIKEIFKMKIERWAVVRKDGTVYSTFANKGEAHCNAASITGTVVLLTGELPEPKKKVKLAPALCRNSDGRFWLTDNFYESEQEARTRCDEFICWPAPVVDKDGFIEVEAQG